MAKRSVSKSTKANISSRPAPSMDEEFGIMLGRVSQLEAELKIAQTDLASTKTALANAQAELEAARSETPSQSASIEAVKTGVHQMRDVLVSAAQELEQFVKTHFDMFDPRMKGLLQMRGILLKAAGETKKMPPRLPSLPYLDVSELVEAVESLRPPMKRSPSTANFEVPKFGSPPKVKID